MKARTAVPFVDTNIIPDRNAGIGSLLWDLQHPRDPDRGGPPLLDRQFAFIDVGVSRAKVATALKTLLVTDLGMDVGYVATERLEAVPSAIVSPMGVRAEEIRAGLSRLISSEAASREVNDWHYVVDREGKVSSVAYSYDLHGNEVWEAYFMGRTFMYSGQPIDFSDSQLDEMLAHDVSKIEAGIDSGPSWDEYRIERNPLEAGLAAFGIALQKTNGPQRIKDKQNVLFLGNVLNHFPREEQIGEFNRISASMEDRDLVIVQVDEVEASFIEVLRVKGRGAGKTRERVRWINTKTLEVQTPVQGSASWRQIRVKPAVDRIVNTLIDCLQTNASSPALSRDDRKTVVRQTISHVFRTFFRALPVEETLRIAIREAVRRLPSEGGPNGIPVFGDDARDAYGGALGLDPSPIVSEEDFIRFGLN